jgi:hypothetical protein
MSGKARSTSQSKTTKTAASRTSNMSTANTTTSSIGSANLKGAPSTSAATAAAKKKQANTASARKSVSRPATPGKAFVQGAALPSRTTANGVLKAISKAASPSKKQPVGDMGDNESLKVSPTAIFSRVHDTD